jgi:hypothetical protein
MSKAESFEVGSPFLESTSQQPAKGLADEYFGSILKCNATGKILRDSVINPLKILSVAILSLWYIMYLGHPTTSGLLDLANA